MERRYPACFFHVERTGKNFSIEIRNQEQMKTELVQVGPLTNLCPSPDCKRTVSRQSSIDATVPNREYPT